MKINEIVTEDFSQVKQMLGKGASMAGSGISSAAQGLSRMFSGQQSIANSAVNIYTKDLLVAKKSAERAGVPFDPKKYVTGIIKKYGFNIDDYTNEIDTVIKSLVSGNFNRTSVNQYANLMQMIGSQQARDSSGRVISTNTTPNTPTNTSTTTTNNATMQVVKSMSNLKNPNDLNKIAKVALNKLYKLDPTNYASLVKQITSGSTKQTQQPTP